MKKENDSKHIASGRVLKMGFYTFYYKSKYIQSLAKKSVFLLTQITKIAVAPMICKIHKWYVPHMKDLKVCFDMTFKLLRKVKVKRVLGWI